MNTRVLHPEADEELLQASNYIDEQRPGHGEKFLQEIEQAFGLIARDPKIWGVRVDKYRRYITRVFKYQIWYRENKLGIYVIAVHHSSRRPGYWKKRISDEQR